MWIVPSKYPVNLSLHTYVFKYMLKRKCVKDYSPSYIQQFSLTSRIMP